MNHITAAQFLELPKEVQKVFIDWWEIEEGDFIYLVDEELETLVARKELDMYGFVDYWYYDFDTDEVFMFDKTPCEGINITIPLFRLDQLWNFIEDKTNGKILVNLNLNNEYFINVINMGLPMHGENKLETFWKAAIKVAEESLEV